MRLRAPGVAAAAGAVALRGAAAGSSNFADKERKIFTACARSKNKNLVASPPEHHVATPSRCSSPIFPSAAAAAKWTASLDAAPSSWRAGGALFTSG